MNQSPFERDRVRQFDVVVVFGDAQLIKRSDGRLEIRGGIEDDRQKTRGWFERFIKPAASPDSTELGKHSLELPHCFAAWYQSGRETCPCAA
jgi:hypothetical protein